MITFILIIHQVWPRLPVQDRTLLHGVATGTGPFRLRGRALDTAWKLHSGLFPESRKRQLFGALFIAAALSLFCYPLYLALR